VNGLAYAAYKAASLAVLPLGVSLLGLVATGLLLHRGRRRAALSWLVVVVTWLWIWSTPVVADALQRGLESQHPFRPAADLPAADAIVVFGGGVSGAPLAVPGLPGLNRGADREWFAAQLYLAGKAPRVIVSAAAEPGSRRQPGAQGMAEFLVALGVPREAIVLEPQARNTVENARFTEERLAALGARRVLLVTSGYHMPRALRALARVSTGRTISPAATSPEAIAVDGSAGRWLPSAAALARSTEAFKEHLGTWALGLQARAG